MIWFVLLMLPFVLVGFAAIAAAALAARCDRRAYERPERVVAPAANSAPLGDPAPAFRG